MKLSCDRFSRNHVRFPCFWVCFRHFDTLLTCILILQSFLPHCAGSIVNFTAVRWRRSCQSSDLSIFYSPRKILRESDVAYFGADPDLRLGPMSLGRPWRKESINSGFMQSTQKPGIIFSVELRRSNFTPSESVGWWKENTKYELAVAAEMIILIHSTTVHPLKMFPLVHFRRASHVFPVCPESSENDRKLSSTIYMDKCKK